jgi:hypothetical protein
LTCLLAIVPTAALAEDRPDWAYPPPPDQAEFATASCARAGGGSRFPREPREIHITATPHPAYLHGRVGAGATSARAVHLWSQACAAATGGSRKTLYTVETLW